jgi:hypothetical protein
MIKTNKINIESKSQLAKLFATENLSVEHNNVKTASFDLENRIVTLPIFKKPQGDVYDMLTAHECSHALHTPMKAWSKLEDPKYRAYVNVIEDTRIDRLIQKKYPGIVRNYINAFEILMKDNFFGLKGKDVNTDLMLIDKINMYYKSSKKLNIKFPNDEKVWLDKIDNIKTFTDVLKIAKELYGWQQKKLEQLAKLPEFDSHPLAKNYKLDKNGKPTKQIKVEIGNSKDDSKSEDKKDNNNGSSKTGNPDGHGGDNVKVDTALDCITDQNFEEQKNKLLDNTKSYRYVTLSEPILKNAIISSEQFLKDMRDNNKLYLTNKTLNDNTRQQHMFYYNWLKQDFLKFKKNSTKTVMYLVKEFEMKKAATAYKRATVDKTGVIDSLKLKNYKFSDDIFKRLTILPNSKNHGMIMLLDWSGSMCDIISKTVHQLCNLIWFCQKTNIPFEVYLFKDMDNETLAENVEVFKKKNGDMFSGKSHLVNVASHRMKKTILHESLQHLYQMAYYFNRNWNNGVKPYAGYPIPISEQYNLTSTPLNEALSICNKLIPLFQSKYKVEKLSFITLTDGEANGDMCSYSVDLNQPNHKKFDEGKYNSQTIVKDGNKRYTANKSEVENSYYCTRTQLTATLLKMIKQKHNVTTIGFFLSKRMNRSGFERFVPTSIFKNNVYQGLNPNFEKLRKQFAKDKVMEISKLGYDSYYVVNAKDMDVENFKLDDIKVDESTSNIKKMFSKSMKNRVYSRVLLNKFIEQIA